MSDLLGPELPEDFAVQPARASKTLHAVKRRLPPSLRLGIILTCCTVGAYLPLIATALLASPGDGGRPMYLGCVAGVTFLVGFVIGIPRSLRFLLYEEESAALGILALILNVGQFPLHLFLLWFVEACLGLHFKP